nr:MAG TPA: hypothetical protein [Caudoviricetes sp.]
MWGLQAQGNTLHRLSPRFLDIFNFLYIYYNIPFFKIK